MEAIRAPGHRAAEVDRDWSESACTTCTGAPATGVVKQVGPFPPRNAQADTYRRRPARRWAGERTRGRRICSVGGRPDGVEGSAGAAGVG